MCPPAAGPRARRRSRFRYTVKCPVPDILNRHENASGTGAVRQAQSLPRTRSGGERELQPRWIRHRTSRTGHPDRPRQQRCPGPCCLDACRRVSPTPRLPDGNIIEAVPCTATAGAEGIEGGRDRADPRSARDAPHRCALRRSTVPKDVGFAGRAWGASERGTPTDRGLPRSSIPPSKRWPPGRRFVVTQAPRACVRGCRRPEPRRGGAPGF